MAYVAYITTIKNLRKHPNADRLQLGECFGNTVCVNMDYTPDMVGIYFPCDGQLSLDFCIKNHLLRKLPDGTPDTGYMDPVKRNIVAIKLRGEKSDGLFLPLTALVEFGDISTLNVGDTIDTFNGVEICKKYIPVRKNKNGSVSSGNKTSKRKVNIAPLFVEHADTEQLAYNLDAFKPGDLVEITLKMHGTSQRTGYLPVFKGYKRTLLDKICGKEGKPIYDWDYVSGTRRTVLENFEGGYYGDNKFREQHAKHFEGKLHKGEEVYYEVVGFTHIGTPIMATADNKKLNDKEFVKQYGKTTTFSYGCIPDGYSESHQVVCGDNQSDIYVYRMTMTNEDGDIVEYTPDFMRYRCEQIGVKCVPVMWKGFIPDHTADEAAIRLGQDAGAWIKAKAEEFYDGPDPIGKTHVREGVVVRILNRPKFCAYKHKNFSFKVLSNIAVADAEVSGTIEGMSEDILAEM